MMKIKAVRLYENGFMTQAFALGGEEGPERFDPAVKYRSSLQNFLIDTGSELILVDTGMPSEAPEAVPDEKTRIYMGTRVKDYVSALQELGYAPEQVAKILVTHKHLDHTGELRAFPNAKVFISAADADAMPLTGKNVVRVAYQDGAYHNFPACEKIAEGIYFIEAKGHTHGNSIIVAETDGLYYMMHGDITYTDEALYANKLSVVYEDLSAARQTLDRVREFIRRNPTVYLSTHTPLGCENLENKSVVDLDDPPASIPPAEVVFQEGTGKYICSVCSYVYDPAVGDPEHGIAAGTPFEDLPEDWRCPRCAQSKDKYNRA